MERLNKILIFALLISLLSCSSQKSKKFEHIKNYFSAVHNFTIDDNVNKIIVITEGTGCPSCDKAFSDAILGYSHDANSIFLVSATGKFINIEPYLNLKNNCFFDCEFNRTEYPEFANTSVICLKNNAVDTIVVINSNEINQQLEFLKTKN